MNGEMKCPKEYLSCYGDISVVGDGDSLFARFNDFENLQESPAGFDSTDAGAIAELAVDLRRQLQQAQERIAELECLISNIGVCVGSSYAVDLQEDIREVAGDFARGQLAMSRRVTRILDDEESRQMNLYEANYLAGLDEYVKENAALKADNDRLRAIAQDVADAKRQKSVGYSGGGNPAFWYDTEAIEQALSGCGPHSTREKELALSAMREALVGLMEEQNGPPLLSREEEWANAMAAANAAVLAVVGK